jgi:hypothetical protein
LVKGGGESGGFQRRLARKGLDGRKTAAICRFRSSLLPPSPNAIGDLVVLVGIVRCVTWSPDDDAPVIEAAAILEGDLLFGEIIRNENKIVIPGDTADVFGQSVMVKQDRAVPDKFRRRSAVCRLRPRRVANASASQTLPLGTPFASAGISCWF